MARIRPAEEGDLEAVIALLEKFPFDPEIPDVAWQDARRTYPELLAGERGLLFVAEEDGAIAGLVSLGFSWVLRFGGPYALIEDFIVDEAYRGKGFAGRLLETAFEAARERGCREVQVNGPTEEGLVAYLRAGMHVAGKHVKVRFGRSA